MRLGPGDTAIQQPGVELGVAPEPRPRHEEPTPEHAHLVLELPLRQRTRTGGATLAQSQPDAGVQDRSLWRHWFKPNGRRIDQVVPAHLLEAAVTGAALADEDRIHRRHAPSCSNHVWMALAGQGRCSVGGSGRPRPCVRRLICSLAAARPDEVRRRSGPGQWHALGGASVRTGVRPGPPLMEWMAPAPGIGMCHGGCC